MPQVDPEPNRHRYYNGARHRHIFTGTWHWCTFYTWTMRRCNFYTDDRHLGWNLGISEKLIGANCVEIVPQPETGVHG